MNIIPEKQLSSNPDDRLFAGGISDPFVEVGISRAFHNKELVNGYTKSAYADSFHPQRLRMSQLMQHAVNGGAWTQARFKSNHRHGDKFQSLQILATDHDDGIAGLEEALNHPFISQYAYAVYESASSTPDYKKCRVIFYIPQQTTDSIQANRYQRALIWKLKSFSPDASTKDAISRLWFGSTNPNHKIIGNILPLDLLDILADEMEAEEGRVEVRSAEENQRIIKNNRAHQSPLQFGKYAQTALDNKCLELSTAPKGERNHMLFRVGAKMGNFIGAGMIDRFEVETCIRNSALQCGLSSREIDQTLSRAINEGMTTPYDLSKLKARGANRDDAPTPHKDRLPHPREPKPQLIPDQFIPDDADVIFMRYFSEHAKQFNPAMDKSLAIQSPIGTGKTEWVNSTHPIISEALGRDAKILFVTYSRALAWDTAIRFDIEHYMVHKKTRDLHEAGSCVVVINSIEDLKSVDGVWAEFDILVIDEIDSVLQHLAGGTFSNSHNRNITALKALTCLERLIRKTEYVFMMDAHIYEDQYKWLQSLRPDAKMLHNAYVHNRGDLIQYDDSGKAYQVALQQAKANRVPLIATCETLKTANTITDDLTANHNWRVLKLTGETTDDPASSAFFADVNNQIKKYDAIVFTSTISTGLDIQEPAVMLGLFNGGVEMTGVRLVQMLGRVRNPVGDTHVYQRQLIRYFELDRLAIETVARRKALNTNQAIEYYDEAEGDYVVTMEAKRQLRLEASHEARHNLALRNSVESAKQVFEASGYTVKQVRDGKLSAESCRLLDLSGELATARDELVLTTESITSEQYESKLEDEDYTMTNDDHAGYEKGKITVFLSISDTHYDDVIHHWFYKKDGIAIATRRLDLRTPESDLAKRDNYDRQNTIRQRKHRLLKARHVNQMILQVFGLDSYTKLSQCTFNKQRLSKKTSVWLKTSDSRELLKLLPKDIRKTAKNPLTYIKRILTLYGIKLELSKDSAVVNKDQFKLWLAFDKQRDNVIAKFKKLKEQEAKDSQDKDKEYIEEKINSENATDGSTTHVQGDLFGVGRKMPTGATMVTNPNIDSIPI